MWSTIAAFIIDRVIKAVVKAIADYLQELKEVRAARKQAKIKVKEIMSEKDPQTRASRMRDWLDS